MSGTTGSGLAVSDVINVAVTISPTATGTRNFGALLIGGPSPVIDVSQRIRQYSQFSGVQADFGSTTPEYQAAQLFFEQNPQPAILYIGRWAQQATAGILECALLSASQQVALLASLQAISTGSFNISINGSLHTISGLNFTGITNLNGAASIIQAALNAALAGTTCVYAPDSNTRFVMTSGTTGTSSTMSFLSTAGSGTDISALIGGTAASGAVPPIAGIAAETPLTAANVLLGSTLGNQSVYGFMFAPINITDISDASHEAVGGMIQALGTSHIYGITSNESNILLSNINTDLASVMESLGYFRSFIQYSSTSPYAVASFYGRDFTVNYSAQNSTLTMKFKQEPGVIPEVLTESQAASLNQKNCNVYATYQNGASIIQQGVMCNGYFFDEVTGLDWLQNFVQTNLWNLFYQTPTKIPQTDAGNQQIVTNIAASMNAAVNNGLVAPGVWTSALQFGSLQTGDTLTAGFYVYAPPIASQAQADREARKSVPIQVACKLAGAIHFANVGIQVNR
jgi:hypothetical protein